VQPCRTHPAPGLPQGHGARCGRARRDRADRDRGVLDGGAVPAAPVSGAAAAGVAGARCWVRGAGGRVPGAAWPGAGCWGPVLVAGCRRRRAGNGVWAHALAISPARARIRHPASGRAGEAPGGWRWGGPARDAGRLASGRAGEAPEGRRRGGAARRAGRSASGPTGPGSVVGFGGAGEVRDGGGEAAPDGDDRDDHRDDGGGGRGPSCGTRGPVGRGRPPCAVRERPALLGHGAERSSCGVVAEGSTTRFLPATASGAIGSPSESALYRFEPFDHGISESPIATTTRPIAISQPNTRLNQAGYSL